MVSALQRVPSEYRIKRVSETRAQAQKNGEGRHVHASGDPGHKGTAHNGGCQRDELHRGDPLPEQDRGHQHHEHRRRVKHHRGDGQRRDGDQAEIAVIEEHHAENSGTRKTPEIPETDPEQAPVIDHQKQEHEDHCEDGAQRHDLHGSQPGGAEAPYKNPDAPPAGACQKNKQDSFCLS